MSETPDTDPVCLCGAPVEEVDSGNGYTYWAHVQRLTRNYRHAAIPREPKAETQ